MNYPSASEGFIPAYQVSALPFVTSSLISLGQVQEIHIPFVTRFINIQNVGTLSTDELAVGFTARGLDPLVGNYFTVGQGVSFRDELRATRLFISCSSGTSVRYQVICGLTTIPERNFMTITGSNGHPGVG